MRWQQVYVWILAMRPKTLWVAVCPVVLAVCLARSEGSFHLLTAVLTLVSALCIQVGTNYANDYFDFIKGADTDERLGPTRATQAGLVTPDAMKKAYKIAFVLAVISSLYLLIRGGDVILIIGAVSIVFGILYSANRFSLSYLGIADLAAFLFFGPVAVIGTYYLQTFTFSYEALVYGVSLGFFSTALLAVNNLRDIHQDRKANKRTLAVRFGKKIVQCEYILSIVLACITPLVVMSQLSDPRLGYLTIAVLLFAIKPIHIMYTKEGRTLNQVLGMTVQLELLITILICLGLLQ